MYQSYKINAALPTPGTRTRHVLPVYGTQLQIPYTLITGAREGLTAVITAGIHSAEYVGVQAAIELARELDPKKISGTVIILPVVNRSGFETRGTSLVPEDGKNLNRVFPGDPEGSVSERLAHVVYETFLARADCCIDLHGGDDFESLEPFVCYVGATPCEAASQAMAACVNTRYAVRSDCRTGGAYNAASMHGVPSVLIERGGDGRVRWDEVQADKADVRNILRCMGILQGRPTYYEKKTLTERVLIAPATGCWYPALEAGDFFRAGDALGEIRNYYGETLHTITAPEDGVLLYQTSSLNLIEKGPMVSYGILHNPA